MHLSIGGVSKRYKGNVWGMRDLSLQLEPGVLALVGPNGAGKSTLMRILAPTLLFVSAFGEGRQLQL